MIARVIPPGLRKAGPGSARILPMAQISQAMGLASLLTTLAGPALYLLVARFAMSWIARRTGSNWASPWLAIRWSRRPKG